MSINLARMLLNSAQVEGLMNAGRYEEAEQIIREQARQLEPLGRAIVEPLRNTTMPDACRKVSAFISEGLITAGVINLAGKTYHVAKIGSLRIAQATKELAKQTVKGIGARELTMATPEGLLIEATKDSLKNANNLREYQTYFREVSDYYAKLSRTKSEIKGVKSLIKRYGLPTRGKIRYVPPKGMKLSTGLPRIKIDSKLARKYGCKSGDVGFIDRFGNVWVKGESRTFGQPFEWDVQLSPSGKNQLGWMTRDNRHLNVSLDGKVTHK